jgi:hypothetical protein
MSCVLAVVAAVTMSRDPSGAWVLNRSLSEFAADEDELSLGPSEQPKPNLVIRATDKAVIFYDEDGLRRIYAFNGYTTWDGATLRIERQTARTTRIIQLYSVNPDERRLTVTVIINRNGVANAQRIRYVYDPIR